MGILDDWQDPIEDRTFGEAVGDYGTSLKQGFVSAGSGLVSLVDMATPGDLRGWLHDTIGYSPEKMNKQYQLDKSAYQQDEELAANSGEGFLGTVKSYAQHPAAIGSGIVETVPYMLAGGALGRVALGLAPGMGVAAASGLGEGLITAGSQEAQMYDEQGGQTSLEQKGLALGSGALTGLIGGVTGRVASKLGFNDKDFFLTAGLPAMAKKLGGEPAKGVSHIAARIAGSGLSEAFQEATQTGQEAMVMNAALGKPIFEGVPQQIGQAVAVAGPTGGAIGVLHAPAVEAMAEFEEGTRKVEKTDELGFRKVKDVLEGEALKDSARQKLKDLKGVEDEIQKPIDGSPLAGATSSPASTEFLNEENQDGLRVSDILQPQKETVDEYLSNTGPEVEVDSGFSPDRAEDPGQAEVDAERRANVDRINNGIIGQMRSDALDGEVGYRFKKEDGYGPDENRWDGVKSTNPEWLKSNKLLKKSGKKAIFRVIDLVEQGKKLTANQQDIWDELQKEGDKEEGENLTHVAAVEGQRIEEEEGIALSAQPEKIAVGTLEEGDKVVVKNHGLPDVVEHKGYDKQGNAILEDGVAVVADPFEMLNIYGKKTKPTANEAQEQTPEELPTPEPPEQDLKGIEVNVPERIEGTDKQIEVKKDAALARTELTNRVEVYKKIADCIGL